ncbi:MAG: dTDP-4-dehydrorhamnose reductase [Pseudomonadota bacterium]
MKLLVFGQSGQVATELDRRAGPDIAATFLSRTDADLADPISCATRITETDADVIINAAAYTAVDKAEAEEPLALQINAEAPGAMAQAAASRSLPFVHISTDYVFDGSGDTPHKPDNPTGPLNVYGKTKLAGEDSIRASSARHVILRTSWVCSAHGSNFVKTMLRLGRERDRLTIVADQIGGPTPAAAIADACLTIARALHRGAEGGTYHFAGSPDTSWAGFAREIFAQAGLTADVVDIPTADYPTPARRPLNSRLDCTSLIRDFGIECPDWQAGLAEVLKELG